MAKRANFYIDGLNVYHAIDNLDAPHLKWLSWDCLARLIIPKQDEQVQDIVYFTAYPTHLESNFPDKLARHRLYVRALISEGAQFVKGSFKKKYLRCKAKCREEFLAHEEKQTDVSIAVRLLEDAFTDRFDVAYIVSGDTDLAPVLKRVKHHFPDKELVIVLSPGRSKNKELQKLTDRKIQLTDVMIERCLLPQTMTDINGKQLDRPSSYDPPQGKSYLSI